MECTIPGRSIKLFVKIIQCLSSIGDYVNFEAQTEKLIFRTISESRSAFVSFTLDKTFFKEYKLTHDNEIGSLRVPLKPCLAVFKNINNIENVVMSINLEESKLIFDIACKMGIKRVYKLFLEDSVILQARYNRQGYPDKISFKPGQMLDSLKNNFQPNLEEITMRISPDCVKITSYIDETRSNANKLLRTEMTLSAKEFLELTSKRPMDLTFCLKEMKAILTFCESTGQSVTLFYEKPGKPLLLVLDFFNVLGADFVLATLIDQGDTMDSSAGAGTQNSRDEDPQSSYDNSGRYASSAASSYDSSLGPSSIATSSIAPSSMISSSLVKEDPYAIPGSLASNQNYTTIHQDDVEMSGHVSGSDDESVPPMASIGISQKRRNRRPVFSSDLQNTGDDSDSDDMEQ